MVQTGHFEQDKDFNLDNLKVMLVDHFNSVDFAMAKNDILPFIKDERELDLWGKEFFISLVEMLNGV